MATFLTQSRAAAAAAISKGKTFAEQRSASQRAPMGANERITAADRKSGQCRWLILGSASDGCSRATVTHINPSYDPSYDIILRYPRPRQV